EREEHKPDPYRPWESARGRVHNLSVRNDAFVHLFKAAAAGARRSLAGDPFIVIFLRLDIQITTCHARMPLAAQLRAIDLVNADLRGDEVNRNAHARDRVL